jgi:hypothetical protein
MKHRKALALSIFALISVCLLAGTAFAQGEQKPQIQIPQPGVPEIMSIEGSFVRAAYNNEGYAILGYKLANQSVGQEWMYLEIGLTLRDDVKDFTMMRDALALSTPDGKTIPMATQAEFQKADLRALERQASVIRDSINYFPPMASKPCRIGYFSEMGTRAMAWDQVELSNTRACLGRIFFQVPGGIAYGQHWLNVKFRDSLIRVPFRILTKEEEKTLDKNYKDIRKQVQEAFKPKKK